MVLRAALLSICLWASCLYAQDEIALRKTLKLVGNDLDQSAKFDQASLFLYYTGGLLLGIGFDKDSDGLLLTGASMVIGGMVTTTISIGKKQSAARLLKEL